MTRILYFIIPLFLMSCGGKEVYNDLKQQNLQGEIKQVRMSSYSVIEKFNQVEKKARTSERENTLTIFNNKGNQVEKTLQQIRQCETMYIGMTRKGIVP